MVAASRASAAGSAPPVQPGQPGVAGRRLRGPTARPASSVRIEAIVARAAGVLGVVFGIQSVPIMLGQLPDLDPAWAALMNIGVFGGLACVAAATAVNRFVRLSTSWVALAYLVALLAWPLAVTESAIFADQKPWLWYLCTVATACAAVAFPVAWATAYSLLVPIVYGVLRTVPSGGSAESSLAALDTVYAINLGLVVLIIITMLRQAAAAVDTAQAAALMTYSTAVRQHATEVERIEVDAIVHDSVLTTLLAAANTRTAADAELAASMALSAVARLDAAGSVLPGDDRVAELCQLERRLRAAVAVFSAPVRVDVRDIAGIALPVQVSEAMYSAAVQALVNSMQHADGAEGEAAGHRPVRRSLSLSGDRAGGVRVVVSDSGVGFDDTQASLARIGLRVSILERIAAAGGVARVRSTPGAGTEIELLWPAPPPGAAVGAETAVGAEAAVGAETAMDAETAVGAETAMGGAGQP